MNGVNIAATLRNAAPAAFSFWCGLASLSLEILWVRLFGFARQSTPKAFGFVLCAFLVGVAFGAAAGRRQCVVHANEPAKLWRAMGCCLLLSGLSALALPALFAAAFTSIAALHAVFIGIALTSFVLAFCFPIAHHLGSQATAMQGRKFARVYASNVAGSALGPLLTGYVLLEQLTLQQSFQVVALLQLVVGAATCWFAARSLATPAGTPPRQLPVATALAGVLACALAASFIPRDPHWLLQQVGASQSPAKAIYESRHGVVALVPDGRDDAVYGGNAYDGRTNTDLIVNSNALHRLAIMSVITPQPKRVLMVGMSVGSWLAVVRAFPGVEHIDVIEINPSYIEAANAYEAQRNAMADARVTIHIDDARRWLRRNPSGHYDAIVMNTTYHWRSNITLLLSAEFLSMMRERLAPGGVLCFNATGSLDALYTASRVFARAYRYDNFVYASDHDFRPLKDAPEALAAYKALMPGRALSEPQELQLRHHLALPFVDYAGDRRTAGRDGELITDGNMIPEFRYGKGL